MIVVPYVAVPLYLMIGGRKYRKLIREKGGVVFGDTEEEFIGDLHPIDTLLRNFGIPGACAGNSLDVFQTGEETFAALMEQIEEAQESIFIETFVFTLDSTGQAIFDALVRRAREGVTVCLLVDGLGSMHFKQRDFKPLQDAGGQGAIFLPVLRLPFQGKTNTRDHRKMAIFDRARVIAGGSNLAEEYMGPTPLPDRWKDINFRLEGPAVRHYMAIFRSDWAFATGAPPPEAKRPVQHRIDPSSTKLQVVPSGPDIPSDSLYYSVLTAAYLSASRYWIATPYFVPDDTLCEGICLAARRGVDVRIIVPSVSNHHLTDLARSTYLRRVIASGGTVVRYNRMFHGKTVIVDDTFALVGSMNADRRSLFINFEVMLGVYDAGLIKAIEQWNHMLMADSVEGIHSANRLRLMYERAVSLIAPQL
ncbi:MAG: phospholipase D-like domain-containing protein [Phycisphaerales bacterium]|nr:phospholipase D-like domain-containing protein [Phycisphaerales bacterium]